MLPLLSPVQCHARVLPRGGREEVDRVDQVVVEVVPELRATERDWGVVEHPSEVERLDAAQLIKRGSLGRWWEIVGYFWRLFEVVGDGLRWWEISEGGGGWWEVVGDEML